MALAQIFSAHCSLVLMCKAAVVTGYVVGTVTNPDGTTREARARRTAVLIKEVIVEKKCRSTARRLLLPSNELRGEEFYKSQRIQFFGHFS